jgi:hypothetical protein
MGEDRVPAFEHFWPIRAERRVGGTAGRHMTFDHLWSKPGENALRRFPTFGHLWQNQGKKPSAVM